MTQRERDQRSIGTVEGSVATIRLAAIHRAMNARHPADGNGHEEGKHKPSQEGIGAFLVREAVGLIKPVLFALVTSQLNPKPAEPASETAPPASSEQGS